MNRYSLEAIDEIVGDLDLHEHLEVEKEAVATGNYDQLKEKNKELIAAGQEVDSSSLNDASSSSDIDSSGDGAAGDAPGDDGLGDLGGDPDAGQEEQPEDKGEAKDDKKPDAEPPADTKDDKSKDATADDKADDKKDVEGSDKKEAVATESLRNEYYDRIVLEAIGYDDVAMAASSVISGIGQMTAATARITADLIRALFDLGVKYSPTIWAFTKKTSIYLFVRAVKLSLKTTMVVSDFIKKDSRSFNKHHAKVIELRKKLDAKKALSGALKPKLKNFEDAALRPWLTSDRKCSGIASVNAIHGFMSSTVSEIGAKAEATTSQIQKLMEMTSHQISGNPVSYLRVDPISGNYVSSAKQSKSGLTDTVSYRSILPNGFSFMVTSPKRNLDTMEDMTAAYRESGILLVPVAETSSSSPAIDYMDIAETEKFINVLEQICADGIKHLSTYQKIEKDLNGVHQGYRHYYQKLTENSEQAAIREGLMELIYLKQNYVSRVYIPAAIDIHHYVTSYLLKAEKYAEMCIDNFE